MWSHTNIPSHPRDSARTAKSTRTRGSASSSNGARNKPRRGPLWLKSDTFSSQRPTISVIARRDVDYPKVRADAWPAYRRFVRLGPQGGYLDVWWTGVVTAHRGPGPDRTCVYDQPRHSKLPRPAGPHPGHDPAPDRGLRGRCRAHPARPR